MLTLFTYDAGLSHRKSSCNRVRGDVSRQDMESTWQGERHEHSDKAVVINGANRGISRCLVVRSRNSSCIEGGDAPAPQGATTEHAGSM